MNDIFDIVLFGWTVRVAFETFFSVFEMRHYAILDSSICSTRRRRMKIVFSSDQQVSGRWETRTLIAGMVVVSYCKTKFSQNLVKSCIFVVKIPRL